MTHRLPQVVAVLLTTAVVSLAGPVAAQAGPVAAQAGPVAALAGPVAAQAGPLAVQAGPPDAAAATPLGTAPAGRSGAVARAATEPPATPVAPPVDNPAGLGSDRCAPPSTTVVPELPWAQLRLAPERAWPLTRGAGVTVAVIDSGVDATVPQLAGHVLPGVDLLRSGGPADTDCAGHGTFVAGIVAAAPIPGVGFTGIAPQATILPIRQFDTDVDGSSDGLAAAIVIAVDRGARVVNISSSAFQDSPLLRAAVDYAAAADVLVVASVANEARNGNPASYPAAYPGVVAVGAVGPDSTRADFSETGSFVDLVAPGMQILSLGPGGPGHLQGDGSSFAAPFVTGTAALIRAYHPELTAAQVKHRLEVTADHPGTALPDPQLGNGVVNPYAAVSMVLPEERGAATAPAPARVAIPQPSTHPVTGRTTGLLFLLGALALITTAGIATAILPRGRHRAWRPAAAFEHDVTSR